MAPSRPGLSFRGRAAALDHALLAGAIGLTAYLVWLYVATHQFAPDFRYDFWVAGARVRSGGPLGPYAWTNHQLLLFGFPYPALAALLFVPFSLLPTGASAVLWVLISFAALGGALRLSGVRDWRVGACALLCAPVVAAWQTGNLTLVLMLALALAWRRRDSPVVLGVVLAVAVSLKPILWPLAVWLLATRRLRAGVLALGVGLTINAAAWATLGFGEISRWLSVIAEQSALLYRTGYGLVALGTQLGLARGPATALQVLVCLSLAVAVLWLARDDELAAFTVAVALCVAASPRVDSHYFALALVPLVVAEPALSRRWLLPLGFWPCPANDVAPWQRALAWLLLAALVGSIVHERLAAQQTSRARSSPSVAAGSGVRPV